MMKSVRFVVQADVHFVRALLEHGANVHAVDANGRTALHHALLMEKAEMAEILLVFGANMRRSSAWHTPGLIHARMFYLVHLHGLFPHKVHSCMLCPERKSVNADFDQSILPPSASHVHRYVNPHALTLADEILRAKCPCPKKAASSRIYLPVSLSVSDNHDRAQRSKHACYLHTYAQSR